MGEEGHEHILLVDDEEDIREAVREVLEDYGYSVRVAVNGKKALETLRSNYRPQLILLDLNMPELNGFEFIKILRGEPQFSDLPVIVLSAAGEKCRFAKANAIVSKPIELEVLLREVGRFCSAPARD